MTVERQHGKVVVHCDKCSEFFEGQSDFRETMADARVAGWVSMQVGDDWEHLCPGHAKETEAKS